jgi:hypothetical protein
MLRFVESRTACALICVLMSAAPAFGQAAPTMPKATHGQAAAAKNAPQPKSQAVHFALKGNRLAVLVRLTHVGVYDWIFLNPRNPPNLIPVADEWDNATRDNIVKVNEALAASAPGGYAGVSGLPLKITAVKEVAAKSAAAEKALADAIRRGKDANAERESLLRANEVLAVARLPLRELLWNVIDVSFDNGTATQQLIVSFDAFVPDRIKGANAAEVRQQFQTMLGVSVHVADCKSADGARVCKATVVISPNSVVNVPLSIMAQLSTDGAAAKPTSFNVAFYQENATPARPVGYFSIVPAADLTEPDSETKFSAAVSASAEIKPDVPDAAVFSEASPYVYKTARDFSSKGLLTVTSNIGSRAVASADLQYKKGVLDGSATPAVTSPRYQVDIHAIKPLALSFGHYEFASPSNGVAIDESGEGIRVSAQRYSLALIFNPDGGPRIPDSQTRYDKEFLVQADGLAGSKWNTLESVNLFGLVGWTSYKAKTDSTASGGAASGDTPSTPALSPGLAHRYWTVGAEVNGNAFGDHVHGSTSLYFSQIDPTHKSGLSSANGFAFDANATWSKFRDAKDAEARSVAYFISAQIAAGGSFVGEHQQFAPDDTQFLGTLFPAVDTGAALGAGLADKRFVSASYTDRRGSLLYIVPKFLLNAPDADIPSKDWSVSLSHYTSTSSAHSGAMGYEISAKSSVESPSQVTFTVGVSYFAPTGFTKTVLGNRSGFWNALLTVKVAL